MIGQFDTIAAIATPPGEGGIAVIRISGGNALVIANKIIYRDKSLKQHAAADSMPSHTVRFGYAGDNGAVVDEVLLTVFKSPNSYTGEDVAEISCHGGSFVAGKVLALILSNGARLAAPGEFTKRAFLNGKLDLTQAEAVADLIRSRTDSAHSASVKQLEGELSSFVSAARAELIRITSLVELELDFAEEGLEFVSRDEIMRMITGLCEKCSGIVASYVQGKVIREGITLVIAGKPNSGKSSLFNKLLDRNRAIVSRVAGTTRDYLEENMIIDGVLFNVIDTAGIRSSDDEIESEGIKRSREKISEADLTLYLVDSGLTQAEIDEEVKLFNENFVEGDSIIAFSKSDISGNVCREGALTISVFDEESIDKLRNALSAKSGMLKRNVSSGELVLTNLRHKLCLENVIRSLTEAAGSVEKGLSGEFISVDLRSAMSHLGEITGEVTNDEILNNIFGSFCIGK